ncbi:chemokine (C-X-C motif) ligand 32b, duplicate 1 isoform X2 [Astyanax mexicanus]|uniref:chemokine (C-X-C motif) ligand 32b, duplicate 1 isoform X2 n=1 Tax=Astyanax mexicanus TaxID=7994 RepID=UPI0020CAA225|nr:chemokine (C-X-C motif) ligand 32b, duplicate 1 isoform X2 [Astyanax mexicanus]
MRTELLCLIAALLLTAILCQETGPVGKCKCLRTSNTVLQVQRVKSYYVQKSGLCHVDAVVFTTVRGIAVCSDPKKPWVKKAMTVVDARTKASLPPSSPAVPTKTAASRPTRITTDLKELLVSKTMTSVDSRRPTASLLSAILTKTTASTPKWSTETTGDLVLTSQEKIIC